MTTGIWWAITDPDSPIHAWRLGQPTDRDWVSLCCVYADRADLVEIATSDKDKCGNCGMIAHGLDLADQHGDNLAWRP